MLPTATPPDSQSQDPSVQAGLEQSVAGRRGSFEHPPTAPITGPEVAADDATVQPPLAGAAAPAPGRSAPRGDFRALADRQAKHARPTHRPTTGRQPPQRQARSDRAVPWGTRRLRHRHTKRPLLSHRLSRQRSLARRSHWTPHPLCRCPVCRLRQARRTSAPASPASQVAPALVSLGHAPDGAQRLTMRLDPPELGQVQMRIDRPPDAPARVEITVEKAETLTLLLRDQPQLQHALDQAGVPPEGRSVTFHVASPEPAPRSERATPLRHQARPLAGRAAMARMARRARAASPDAQQAGRRRMTTTPNSRRSRRQAGCAPASTSPPDAKGQASHEHRIRRRAAEQRHRSHAPRRSAARPAAAGAQFAVGEFRRLPQAADDAAAEPGPDQPDGHQPVHHASWCSSPASSSRSTPTPA